MLDGELLETLNFFLCGRALHSLVMPVHVTSRHMHVYMYVYGRVSFEEGKGPPTPKIGCAAPPPPPPPMFFILRGQISFKAKLAPSAHSFIIVCSTMCACLCV